MTKRATTTLVLSLLTAALMPSLSAAEFRIEPESVEVKALDSGGLPDTRAGAHPDRLSVSFEIETTGSGTATRDLIFEFEPGLTGSPTATPTCARVVFELEACPENTRVGTFKANFEGGEFVDQAIYNLAPASDQLAVLAFHPFWLTEFELGLRPDNFGLNIATLDMPQLPIRDARIELWGVPADHNGAPSTERAAFLTTPTQCGPMHFVLHTRSWKVGAPWLSEAAETTPFSGCEDLPFEPSLALNLTNPNPDSPTGVKIDLNQVQHNDPDGTADANMKDVHIDLPPGLSLSPSGVGGREPCTDGQFGLGTDSEPTCPFHSRVGSVEVGTPQLGENLVGSMFLGQERPGERFRLFVQAAARGVEYKAQARLVADRLSGRISTDLNGLPPFAFNRISLDFEGGSHSLLATPLSCGPQTARGRFVPSTGAAAVESAASVSIGGSCAGPPPFAPVTVAGSTDLSAGKSTGFALTFTRQEGEQLPGRYSLTLPPGLIANLNGAEICSPSVAARGACAAASKIGSAVAEVGSGPNPAQLPGSIYLTGPYGGAPFGLSIPFRAAIGPFDLGMLNVRVTLRIDPHTGQVLLDYQLPTIFEGVPVRFRQLGLDLPRGNFLGNPTSCEEERLSATTFSVDGRAATSSVPFHVDGCDALGFKPKFSVALDQRGQHDDNPELSFVVSVPKGQANLKRLNVKFPHVLKFHNAGLKEICTRGDAAEDRCRPRSRVGTAVANSPLIGEPLRGPVYVVQPKGGGFPDLWSNVEGMGIKLQLRSESDGKNGHLTTKLIEIPDLPLANFTMRVNGGGKKGALISIGGNLCAKRGALSTPVELEGHNGATRAMKVQMKTGCSKSNRSKRPGKGRTPSRNR